MGSHDTCRSAHTHTTIHCARAAPARVRPAWCIRGCQGKGPTNPARRRFMAATGAMRAHARAAPQAASRGVRAVSRRGGGVRRAAPQCGGSDGLTYKDAGVDIDAGAELVARIAKACPGVGGFGGLFPFGDSYLVAGADGVGTKLKLAFEMDDHSTIGQDLVAMSVNDIVTLGAEPLFFLDYFATSKLDVDQAEAVIVGIVNACEACGCALLGGETAEMPGFYQEGEYDLSGFAVGAVKKDKVIDGKRVQAGDVLVGLPSSGVHSNGFSLVRRVIEKAGADLKQPLSGDPQGRSLGAALLAPTELYVKPVLKAIQGGLDVRALCHVTGGGFTENLPRVMPEGLGCQIVRGSWSSLPVFEWIQEAGGIAEDEMLRTFNCGVGMVLALPPEDAKRCVEGDGALEGAVIIGEVKSGISGVEYV